MKFGGVDSSNGSVELGSMAEEIKAFFVRVRWNEPRDGVQTMIYACAAATPEAAEEAVRKARPGAEEVAFTGGQLSPKTISALHIVANEVRAL